MSMDISEAHSRFEQFVSFANDVGVWHRKKTCTVFPQLIPFPQKRKAFSVA